jgi:membrane fusion protein, multidrug efflux system
LKSTFPNEQELLWPGQFVELRLERQIVKDAVTIPSAALQRGQQGFFVYVVNPDNVVEVRNVKSGDIARGRAIIESGLSIGDRVVTSGAYQLGAGVQVAVGTGASSATGTDEKR